MHLLSLLDSLDGQIQDAKPIPLTDQIRLDQDTMRATLHEMRETTAGAASPLIDELDGLLQHARPVPLTSDVRLRKPELEDVVSRMRATITADSSAGN